jgi:hypothetical protein
VAGYPEGIAAHFPSAIRCLPSAVCCLLSAICCLLSAICRLLSAVCYLLSAICCLLSVLSCLLSPVCCIRNLDFCNKRCLTIGHVSALNLLEDVKYLKEKVDAGTLSVIFAALSVVIATATIYPTGTATDTVFGRW